MVKDAGKKAAAAAKSKVPKADKKIAKQAFTSSGKKASSMAPQGIKKPTAMKQKLQLLQAQSATGRPVRAVRTKEKMPAYLVDPRHALKGPFGGTAMEVTLGPAGVDSTNRGSGTSDQSIPKWMKPLHTRDPDCWIAGHLLNDNMGGSGTDVCNLTPLTRKANADHEGYENAIKGVCIKAKQFDAKEKDRKYWYGVYYKVVVSKAQFDPTRVAASNIKVWAHLVAREKGSSSKPVEASKINDDEVKEAIKYIGFGGFSGAEVKNKL